MKTGARIDKDVQPENLRRLAAATCLRAFSEIKMGGVMALDAVIWLTSPAGDLFLSAAGLDYVDPLKLLISGKLHRARVKTKGNGHATTN